MDNSDAPVTTWNHSSEAEQAVLGALLLDNAAFDGIADLIQHADFYRGDHRLIFQHCERIIGAGQPADALTLAESLARSGDLAEAGGQPYIASLALNTPSVANVRRYAEIVRERSIKRRLFSAAQEILSDITAASGRNIDELLDAAQERIFTVDQARTRGNQQFVTLDRLIPEIIEFVDGQHERFQRGEINDVIGLPSGFTDLDRMTAGLHPGQLVILAARPSMGKSALSLNIAEHAARFSKKTALYFNLEMGNNEQGLRLLASTAGVNVRRLVQGRIYEHEWPRVADVMMRLNDVPMAFLEKGGLTIMELRSLARKAAREFRGISMIVVDYIQLMLAGQSEANRATQLAEISSGLKHLAKELQVPVLALAQLNRELEKRMNKRPLPSDLRDSGALEQDADVILFIYRDEVYHAATNDKGVAEIIIAKQRNGPVGTARLAFRADQTRFLNLEDDVQQEVAA